MVIPLRLLTLRDLNRLCLPSALLTPIVVLRPHGVATDNQVFLSANVLDLVQRDDILGLVLSLILVVDDCALVQVIHEESLDKLGEFEKGVSLFTLQEVRLEVAWNLGHK